MKMGCVIKTLGTIAICGLIFFKPTVVMSKATQSAKKIIIPSRKPTFKGDNFLAGVPKEWQIFLRNLKNEMKARGISQKTIDRAYGNKSYYHKAATVVQQDKKQAEFIMTTARYVNMLVSKDRVDRARLKYKDLLRKYQKIEKKYSVPLNYITAFWGVETNFGSNKGKHNLIDSLTNLSYRNRRSKFFKNELYNVLKIMDKNGLSGEKMLGSWAGAMGHFQFMPSTYNGYAVDEDGDGIPDIWDSLADAVASAENYLTKLGWKTGEPWGTRVRLPKNFDFKLAGRAKTKTVKEWKKIGVITYDGKKLPFDDSLKGAIIMPDGYKGPIYIVFSNFNRIMIWNRSDNYAIAVVTLADYIADNSKKWEPLKAEQQYVLNTDEILKIQKFSNRLSGKKIKEDGRLGSQTRAAVAVLQHRFHLPEDGYPDNILLKKIDSFGKKKSKTFPIPVKKPKHK